MEKGFGSLNKYKVSFDLQIYQHQIKAVVQLAPEHLGTMIILNQCSKLVYLKAIQLY